MLFQAGKAFPERGRPLLFQGPELQAHARLRWIRSRKAYLSIFNLSQSASGYICVKLVAMKVGARS